MKFIVKTPSPTFSDERCGIKFEKGSTGEVELTEVIVKAFQEAGYEVAEVKEDEPKKAPAKSSKKRGE